MTATAPDTERIKLLLDAFTEIRDDLQKVLPLLDPNFAQGKAPPFPIVEMDLKSAELKCFLGMTYFDKTLPDLEDDTSVQHPPIFFLNLQASLARHVCRIEMKMQLAGRVTDFLRVLPTFLHELAHGYREAIRVRQNTDFQAAHQHAKLKKTTLKPPIDHSTHDDLFYQCFKEILEEAEKMEIYCLPPRPHKFTPQVLRRFDQIDMAECALSGDGKQRPIVYDCDTHKGVADLLKLAQAKLNARPKPTAVWTNQGELLTDDMILLLEPQTVIRVGKPKA